MSYPVSMKAGASVSGVSSEMAFGLVIIAGVFQARSVPCVVTACTDGRHGNASLHYQGAAVDLRLPSRIMGDAADLAMVQDLRAALGEEWDVVLEDANGPNGHIHIEHDPPQPDRSPT